VCFCGRYDSSAPNKDIVRSTCGGENDMLQPFGKKKTGNFFEKKTFYVSLVVGEFCVILIGLDPLYLGYWLAYNYDVHDGSLS